MDDDAWLAAVPWTEGPLTIDEVLGELLQEVYEAVECEVQPPVALVGRGESTRTASADSDTEPNGRRPKRKRVRLTRPKDQIEELREAVRSMNEQVVLLRSRKQRRLDAASTCGEVQGINKVTTRTWMEVAIRQHQYLSEAQRENAKLRSQVAAQMNLIQRMARLLRRACTDRLSSTVPRLLQPAEIAFRTTKRQHFFQTANSVHQQALEFLMQVRNDSLSPDTVEQYLMPDSAMNGPFLGQALVLNLVPHPFSRLCDELWMFDQNASLSLNLFRSSIMEKTPNLELSGFSVTFDTPVGRADFVGLGLRCRAREPSRDIIITIGGLWATTSTPPPFDGVNVEMRMWSVVQPHLGSSGEINEVITKVETWKDSSPFLSDQVDVSLEQAKTLHRIVRRQHDHHLTGLRRHLDSIMMGGCAVSPQ